MHTLNAPIDTRISAQRPATDQAWSDVTLSAQWSSCAEESPAQRPINFQDVERGFSEAEPLAEGWVS
jgi:hypothetical protein